MPSRSIDQIEFEKLVQPLIGLEVSLPWKGYGTAIFLELGELTPHPFRDGSPGPGSGQANIGIEWDWRVETRTEVVYGSSGSRREMTRGIATLQGSRVTALSVTAGIPELRVTFSNGYWLRTMVMRSVEPQWRIRLPDGLWLHVMEGQVVLDRGDQVQGLSEEKEEVADAADATAARWGKPRLEPAPGNCRDCHSFIYLDGDFALSDYGCCTLQDGPFEGRAVNVGSGCPRFQPWQTGDD